MEFCRVLTCLPYRFLMKCAAASRADLSLDCHLAEPRKHLCGCCDHAMGQGSGVWLETLAVDKPTQSRVEHMVRHREQAALENIE